MATYEINLSKLNYHSLQPPLLSYEAYLHIIGVIESSPTSQFYYKIEKKTPNICVYLIEYNKMEAHTICHFFSCDNLDSDYSYQIFDLEQFKFLGTFLEELDFI